jgi:NAD(P)-dependent dehydrogenase (short-subunit alcohol dehydrogenase family)
MKNSQGAPTPLIRTAFITGCSSGIGRAAVTSFAARGWNVVAGVRSLESVVFEPCENVVVVPLDVTIDDQIQHAVELTVNRFGRIDVLVNNAGYALAGLFESLSPESVNAQFATNVFGLLNVTRASLPHLRASGGVIVNVSSRAGLIGLPMMSMYCASKYAVEGFSEALAFELASQNVAVKLIEPSGGVSDTNFGMRAKAEAARSAILASYEDFVERMEGASAATRAVHMISSAECAEHVYAAATDGTSRLRYVIGVDTGGLLNAKQSMSDDGYWAYARAKHGA